MSAVPVHQLRQLCDVYGYVGIIAIAFDYEGAPRLIASPSSYAEKRAVRDVLIELAKATGKQLQEAFDEEFLESTMSGGKS